MLPPTPPALTSLNEFTVWRRVHRASSSAVGVVALVHSLFTFMWDSWSPNAVWFLGTGVGLLTIAVINLAHIGTEPCARPTARVILWLNWIYVVLGLVALIAVREPQAVFIVAALIGQGIASWFTLYRKLGADAA